MTSKAQNVGKENKTCRSYTAYKRLTSELKTHTD